MPPLIDATIAAIKAVRNRRFLATERGYQGAFYCELRSELDAMGILSERVILEMEYQKSRRHNTSQRPDIILHVPTDVSGGSVRRNNFAVWALKRAATHAESNDDFGKLDEMHDELGYPLLIFVNVASGDNTETRLDDYGGNNRARIHAFGVPGPTGSEIKHSYFKNRAIRNRAYPLR